MVTWLMQLVHQGIASRASCSDERWRCTRAFSFLGQSTGPGAQLSPVDCYVRVLYGSNIGSKCCEGSEEPGDLHAEVIGEE